MSGLWAVYIGNGQCVYLEAEPDSRHNGIVTQESVKTMMQHGACRLQITW